jgi:putative toxin-antitoxin system antitoxin component (TIGR02293 family)
MARGLESEPVRSEIDAVAGRSAALQAYVVSRDTLELQRKKEGLLMAAHEISSEEIARILAIAGAAFDDDERAVRWLQEPNIQTGTRPPVTLIGTPEGFAVVESVLRQIQYGVFG